MRKLALFLFALWTSVAGAAVTVTPVANAVGWTAIPGQTLHPYVIITGGTLNTGVWTNPGGGITISSQHNTQNTVSVTFDPAKTGTCSWVGAATVTSTNTSTLVFTSDDDPTKTATYVYNICTSLGTVNMVPFYQQAWSNTPVEVQAFVWDPDETGTWGITGTGCSISDSTNRDVVVTGTTTGVCSATYTATHGGGTATAIVEVVAAPPSYAVTPNQTMPIPCVATARFTHVFEIGPIQTYTTLSAAFGSAHLSGTIARIHNEDITGLSPTTFHEYFQEAGNGTHTAPIYICGVPDSLGNLPIVDGDASTSNVNTSSSGAAGLGGVSTYGSLHGSSAPFGPFQSGPYGPTDVIIAGLHIRNFIGGYYFQWPGSPSIVSMTRGSPYAAGGGLSVTTAGSGQTDGTYYGIAGTGPCTGVTGYVVVFGGQAVSGDIQSGGSCSGTGVAHPTFTPPAGGTPGVMTANTIFPSVTMTLNLSDTMPGFNCVGNSNGLALVIAGATSSGTSFNGTFNPSSCTGTTVTWNQIGATESAGVGSATVVSPWGGGIRGINHLGGSYISDFGNDLDNDSLGIFWSDNPNNLWALQTVFCDTRGNHFAHNGNVGSFLDHSTYNQCWWSVTEQNHYELYNAGASGSAQKYRGVEFIDRYNFVNTATARSLDGVEYEDGQYMNALQFIQAGLIGSGDTSTPAVPATFQAAAQNDYVYGNIFTAPNASSTLQGCQTTHYLADNGGGMNTRQGTLNYYFNNCDMVFKFFDTTGQDFVPSLTPQVYAANNVLFSTYQGCCAIGTALVAQGQTVGIWQNNVIYAGPPVIDVTPPITGGNHNGGTAFGWQDGCNSTPCFLLFQTIDQIQTGLPTFITSTPVPYNQTTFAPITSSVLLNASTPVTGLAAKLPVRYYWDVTANYAKPRTDISGGSPTTIGPVPGGAAPPATSNMSVSGNSKVTGNVRVQ